MGEVAPHNFIKVNVPHGHFCPKLTKNLHTIVDFCLIESCESRPFTLTKKSFRKLSFHVLEGYLESARVKDVLILHDGSLRETLEVFNIFLANHVDRPF